MSTAARRQPLTSTRTTFLYDLKVDPWQLNNVVANPSYAQVKEDMRARLADWIERAEGTRPAIVD